MGTPLTSLDVTASTINLNAGDNLGLTPTVSTTNGQIYNGPVLLGADAALSDTGGGAITLTSALMAHHLGDQSLHPRRRRQVAIVDGYVGANIPLASFGVEATTINLNAGDDNLAEPTVFTAAGQFYDGAVNLWAPMRTQWTSAAASISSRPSPARKSSLATRWAAPSSSGAMLKR